MYIRKIPKSESLIIEGRYRSLPAAGRRLKEGSLLEKQYRTDGLLHVFHLSTNILPLWGATIRIGKSARVAKYL